MTILYVLILVTLYAIGITVKYISIDKYVEELEDIIRIQSEAVEKYMKNSKDQIELLKERLKQLNDAVFRKDKEIRRHIEINSKLMERLKRVMP